MPYDLDALFLGARKVEEVELSNGSTVYVRELSQGEQERISIPLLDKNGDVDITKSGGIVAATVVAGLCNEDGTPAMQDNARSIKRVQENMPARLAAEIAEHVRRVSGLVVAPDGNETAAQSMVSEGKGG